MYIKGNTGDWEYVIGLEVHAQISSQSKLFSGSATEFGNSPNTQVSLVDAALPGMLPVLNEYCVHQAIKTGLGLKAKINNISVFDRKNYFYPDTPQGYQITQFYRPIVENGHIDIILQDNSYKTIRINRLHLEQDAGKSMHDQSLTASFIDLNRCGIGLMEIVTEPDLSSPYEVVEYLKKLRAILRAVGSCDGDMEKGSMRCDANISIKRPRGELGIRCEIKNLNSIRNIVKALEFEAIRQVAVLESGGVVEQETRLYDANTGKTKAIRRKEEAHDYRYFADPDLLPLVISDDLIQQLANTLPELPDAKINRYITAFALNKYDAQVIASDESVAKYFEQAAKFGDAKLVANWIISELFGLLNKHALTLQECKVTPEMLGSLVSLIKTEVISGKIAKIIFATMFATGKALEEIMAAQNLTQISDAQELTNIIEEVIKENQDAALAYKNGKDKLFGFFVGQVMQKTAKKANPNLVNQILKEKLK